MTITFRGHVHAMEGFGAGVKLTLILPMDPCGGEQLIVVIPQAQAKHWLPGRMVSFTLYTLPEPEGTTP